MNENLKGVIEVLVKNIAKSNVEVPEGLMNKLRNDVKSGEVRSLMKVGHLRMHRNVVMSTNECEGEHCLECIVELGVSCEHGKRISLFERALFRLACMKIEFLNKEKVTMRKCGQCGERVDSIRFIKTSCNCECFNCVISRYRQYQYFCSYCMCYYSNSDVHSISKVLNQFIRIYCLRCFDFINTTNSAPANYCNRCLYEV